MVNDAIASERYHSVFRVAWCSDTVDVTFICRVIISSISNEYDDQ